MKQINYGIFGNLKPIQNSTNNNSSLLPVRVLDIVLNDTHPLWNKYGGWDALGLIVFTPYYSSVTDNNISVNVAKPLHTNIKSFPLLQEITYVASFPDPSSSDNTNASSYYYFNTVNIWNHPHHNAFPNINYDKLPENIKLDYKEIESGLVKKESDKDKKLFSLGSSFKEKGNIKPLLPFEGDIIYEGRQGQSIRFGSTTKDLNPWSSIGENGNPITIIRNGQSSKVDEKGWIPTIENINEDGGSIYMCDGQTIPIEVSSFNLKSFNITLQEVKYPIITLLDSPTSNG